MPPRHHRDNDRSVCSLALLVPVIGAMAWVLQPSSPDPSASTIAEFDDTGALVMEEVPSYRVSRDSEMIPQAQMKMKMEDFFDVMTHQHIARVGSDSDYETGAETETETETGAEGDGKMGDSGKVWAPALSKEFDGAELSDLPVMDQELCGSCWAVSSSMAIKANLQLKKAGLRSTELPSLQFMISCSNRPAQIMNFRNSEKKVLMKNGPTRHSSCGCEGGLTAMALSMLQIEGRIHVDDVRNYTAGFPGSYEAGGPVAQENTINIPGVDCAAYRSGPAPVLPGSVTRGLDLTYGYRRKNHRGVFMPTTRDVREFVAKHRAAVIYVDTDAGLGSAKLYSLESVNLPECRWKTSDVAQSDESDRGAISQFKFADHAMLLVGWSCARKAWLLQNSWGKGWGKEGKIYVRDDNVCADDYVVSAHSSGAGPACMFASGLMAFTSSTLPYRLD
jgi:hypothetical protein